VISGATTPAIVPNLLWKVTDAPAPEAAPAVGVDNVSRLGVSSANTTPAGVPNAITLTPLQRTVSNGCQRAGSGCARVAAAAQRRTSATDAQPVRRR
jgi:hypothetical protein